jgi:hypothetical protein
VVRLIGAHPDVKQVRLNINEHSVRVGFYETPSEEALNQIKTDVRAELSGEWDVSIKADDKSPTVHLHKIGNYTTEFHRAHPNGEPPVIWRSIALPAWRNRPFPRPVARDYRLMLLLAATCGLSTLAGFLFGRAGPGELIAASFVLAYLSRRIESRQATVTCNPNHAIGAELHVVDVRRWNRMMHARVSNPPPGNGW